MPAQSPDPIKAMVLRAVQHHLVTGPSRPPLLEAPLNVIRTTAHSLRPGIVKLRVYTEDQGVRQFTIRTTEDKIAPPRDRT